jgi:hypothetical protein
MKRIFSIAFLQMLGVVLCGATDESKTPFRYAVAADFGECPNGHKALRDVPVVWGLVGPLYKKPSDYDDEDRALMRKVENGDVVLGGDLFPAAPPDLPKTKVVCRKCGFSYEDQDGPEFRASWFKTAKTPKEFRIKFSEMLQEFPLLKPVQGSITYWQSVNIDGKQLDVESVTYVTSLPFDDALKAMRKWLIDLHRDPADLKLEDLGPRASIDPLPFPGDPTADKKAPNSTDAESTKSLSAESSIDKKKDTVTDDAQRSPSAISNPRNFYYYKYKDEASITVRDGTDSKAGKASIELHLTHKALCRDVQDDGK